MGMLQAARHLFNTNNFVVLWLHGYEFDFVYDLTEFFKMLDIGGGMRSTVLSAFQLFMLPVCVCSEIKLLSMSENFFWQIKAWQLQKLTGSHCILLMTLGDVLGFQVLKNSRRSMKN